MTRERPLQFSHRRAPSRGVGTFEMALGIIVLAPIFLALVFLWDYVRMSRDFQAISANTALDSLSNIKALRITTGNNNYFVGTGSTTVDPNGNFGNEDEPATYSEALRRSLYQKMEDVIEAAERDLIASSMCRSTGALTTCPKTAYRIDVAYGVVGINARTGAAVSFGLGVGNDKGDPFPDISLHRGIFQEISSRETLLKEMQAFVDDWKSKGETIGLPYPGALPTALFGTHATQYYGDWTVGSHTGPGNDLTNVSEDLRPSEVKRNYVRSAVLFGLRMAFDASTTPSGKFLKLFDGEEIFSETKMAMPRKQF